jgi:hypothetical protein
MGKRYHELHLVPKQKKELVGDDETPTHPQAPSGEKGRKAPVESEPARFCPPIPALAGNGQPGVAAACLFQKPKRIRSGVARPLR